MVDYHDYAIFLPMVLKNPLFIEACCLRSLCPATVAEILSIFPRPEGPRFLVAASWFDA